MVAFSLVFFVVSASAASAPEITACTIVSGADAQTFIGGPLDVKESAKVPVADNPSSYTSTCSYLGRVGGGRRSRNAASGEARRGQSGPGTRALRPRRGARTGAGAGVLLPL